MEATTPWCSFPSDLLFDIFSKLPTKTLIRFQCISKSIRAMITDPTFISTHRNWSADNNSGYIIQLRHGENTTYFFSRADDPKFPTSKNDVLVESPDEVQHDINMTMINSCGDLLCFAGITVPCSTYLWNPSIRVVKKLPDSNSLSPNFDMLPNKPYSCWIGIDSRSNYLCGIGFDSRSNDYKVVQIIHGLRYLCCQVYTLSTNSWRWIESEPLYDLPTYYYNQTCTCFNDSLCWVAMEFILRFSLSDELFEKISLPYDQICDEGIISKMHVGSVKESLALFVDCLRSLSMSVWISTKEFLEGGGIRYSWFKQFIIGSFEWDLIPPRNFRLHGELVMIRCKDWSRQLFVLDKQQRHKELGLEFEIKEYIPDVHSYSQSLVLLTRKGVEY